MKEYNIVVEDTSFSLQVKLYLTDTVTNTKTLIGAFLDLGTAERVVHALKLSDKLIPIQVKDMYLQPDWSPGKPLPPGNYEVAILTKGQDNVLITTEEELTTEQLAERALDRWGSADTDELGNEWEDANGVVIRPLAPQGV